MISTLVVNAKRARSYFGGSRRKEMSAEFAGLIDGLNGQVSGLASRLDTDVRMLDGLISRAPAVVASGGDPAPEIESIFDDMYGIASELDEVRTALNDIISQARDAGDREAVDAAARVSDNVEALSRARGDAAHTLFELAVAAGIQLDDD